MCAIAGFLGFDDGAALAARAAEAQRHRGPDAAGLWAGPGAALAHRRLAIIDLDPRANQPFEKHGLVMVFNGEIYNYRELRAALARDHGCRFHTGSDTEVLLEAFHHLGERCFDALLGMYAFAVFEPSSGTLTLARDPFGIKPLFYSHSRDRLAFASELKALASVPGLHHGIDPAALAGALNYQWVPGERSMFRGIGKLPAGTAMVFRPGAAPRLLRHWSPPQSAVGMGDAEASERLGAALAASVRRHLVADVPVGTFLSGGLDSSIIAALAVREGGALASYAVGFDPGDARIEAMPQDAGYARTVARRFGLDHHELELRPDVLELLPAMVRALDEPIGDPAAINTFLICRAARAAGSTVVLSGMGADEILGGYRRQRAMLLAQRYRRLPGAVRAGCRAAVAAMPVRAFGRGLRTPRWAKRFLGFAELPAEHAYRRSYSYYDESELLALFVDPPREEMQSLWAEHRELFESRYRGDLVNQMCHTDLHMFMQGLNLTYTDRASMAASVEVRVPFVDREVIECAMSMPGRCKLRGGRSKLALRNAGRALLPASVVQRPKASFGAPIRSWISGALRGLVDDVLSADSVRSRGLFRPDAVARMVREDRCGQSDRAYQIYQLLTVELWFREFVDAR